MSSSLGGIEAVLEMLKTMDAESQNRLLNQIRKQDPSLATEIQKRLFQFEDLIKIPNSELSKALGNTPHTDLALALRLSSEELKAHLFRSLSKRSIDAIESLDEFQNPQPKSKVLEAQERIIRSLKLLFDK